jgi:diacylglycerol kinase family enzyme
MLRDYSARKWKIWIDGEKISARYILWEAMNIRSVGPALYLAPRAAIKDGRFDFVSVRENERTVLAKHLEARLAGKKTKFPLPFRRFSRLEVISQKSPIHFDDELWPGKKDKPKKGCEIEITVKPAALLILQPGK